MYHNNYFLTYFGNLVKKLELDNGKPSNLFWKVLLYLKAIFHFVWEVLADAAVELIFVILIGYVIVNMSQGRDLIVSMFEPGSLYSVTRVILTIITTIFFSVSMWFIPAFLFEERNKAAKRRNPTSTEDSFGEHLFFVHRFLPMIPFWLLAFALFNDSAWLFVGLAITQLLLIHFALRRIKTRKQKNLFILAILLILLVLLIYFFKEFQIEYLRVKRALAAILFLISSLLYFTYYSADKTIIEEHYTGDLGKKSFFRYYKNSWFFVLYAALHFTIIMVLLFKPISFQIAPESMLLYGFSFYVFIIDVFFYLSRLKPNLRTGGLAFLVTCAGLMFYGKLTFNNSHNWIDREALSEARPDFHLKTIEDYYAQWRTRILESREGVSFPVVLVAGEGGGSRAGYWFSQNLIDFDRKTDAHFREHIFSLSTVSGSTVGLGTYFQYLNLPLIQKDSTNFVPKEYLDLPANVYKNNFVGSSISGILFSDFFKSICPGRWTDDRNTSLINEEAEFSLKATTSILQKTDTRPKESILKREFISVFYDKDSGYRKFDCNYPLAFINTCRSDDGRRGIFSPVRLDTAYFNDAIDITSYIYNDSSIAKRVKRDMKPVEKGISLGQACVASELFPFLSPPMYIDSLGSFVDGGYHENTGLKTTIDVYNKLVRLIISDKDPLIRKKVEIYIVYLQNGGKKKDLYERMDPSFGLLQPLSALIGQPFNGSASYFEEKVKYLSNRDDSLKTTFLKVSLPTKLLDLNIYASLSAKHKRILGEITNDLKSKKDSAALNFPLARWLSNSVILRMYYQQANQYLESDDLKNLMSKVKLAHSAVSVNKK